MWQTYKILFYCHEAGKITYGWFFFIDCCFKASVNGERILFRLRAMPKNSVLCGIVLQLSAMPHSADFPKKFYLRLRAMPSSVKFRSEIGLPNSALCGTAGSHDWVLCGKFPNCLWIRNHMRKYFNLLISDPSWRGIDSWKKPKVENLVTLSFSNWQNLYRLVQSGPFLTQIGPKWPQSYTC
jgi:hypothetical protein